MMIRHFIVVILSLYLSACASHLLAPEEFSGFLSDYSQLEEVESADEVDVWRWVSPKFTKEVYSSLIFEPIVLNI